MTRKGRNSRKPISKARLQLGDHEGRHQHPQRQIFRARRWRLARHVDEQLEIFLADVLEHECAERIGRPLEGLLRGDLVVDQRLDAEIVGALERRPHHEGGEEQRERDDHGVGRRRRGAERGAQQRQHHDDAGERRHHHQDGRRERQHRHQRDELEHALGEPAALAEIDADVLRPCGRSASPRALRRSSARRMQHQPPPSKDEPGGRSGPCVTSFLASGRASSPSRPRDFERRLALALPGDGILRSEPAGRRAIPAPLPAPLGWAARNRRRPATQADRARGGGRWGGRGGRWRRRLDRLGRPPQRRFEPLRHLGEVAFVGLRRPRAAAGVRFGSAAPDWKTGSCTGGGGGHCGSGAAWEAGSWLGGMGARFGSALVWNTGS